MNLCTEEHHSCLCQALQVDHRRICASVGVLLTQAYCKHSADDLVLVLRIVSHSAEKQPAGVGSVKVAVSYPTVCEADTDDANNVLVIAVGVSCRRLFQRAR